VFLGVLKHPALSFDTRMARINTNLLMLALFGLIVPAVFNFSAATERELSLEVSVVLFLVYVASVVYTLVSGRSAVAEAGAAADPSALPAADPTAGAEAEEPGWSRNKALGVLAAVAIGLAVMSEILTDAVEPAARSLGLTPLFAGVFLLALVGNAADLFGAVRFARQDQLSISIGITVGSSTQMILLVAPLLVFFGYAFGQPMNLLFSKFELVALVMAIAILQGAANTGFAFWLGGLMLMAIYFILGFGFYFAPPGH